MDYRIEMSVKPQWQDARGQGVVRRLAALPGLPHVNGIRTRSVYTVSADITPDEAAKVAQELADPVTRSGIVGETPSKDLNYTWLIRVGFKPGVTDNVARTAWEAIGDIIGRKLTREEQVFSSIEYLVDSPEMTREQARRIATGLLANVLIETVDVFSRDELLNASIPLNKPLIRGLGEVIVHEYDLEVSDEKLMELSHKGTLALSLEEMKSIQGYFRKLGRKPTDVEMEVLAQTWSEHCKHKIFAADIDYTTPDGKTVQISSLYKSYIKKSTKELQAEIPWLVSVFTDNAGVIRFNDRFDLVYKAETHNSPSALDPYGGAMTGIVGVNRDPLGTGQGADLLLNVWGYCLGSPFTDPINVPE
ncbi:MAG: phosphoribosylformylglycinamidine synthase, partial [Lentisphaeria bacterium]|nr:phosphoribosylformylglycinamidine synthase [Lentisphaeria bacterium]